MVLGNFYFVCKPFYKIKIIKTLHTYSKIHKIQSALRFDKVDIGIMLLQGTKKEGVSYPPLIWSIIMLLQMYQISGAGF